MRLIFKVLERTLKSLQGFSFKKSFLTVQVPKCDVLLVRIFLDFFSVDLLNTVLLVSDCFIKRCPLS